MNQLSELSNHFLCFNFFIHNFPPQHPLLSPLCLVPSLPPPLPLPTNVILTSASWATIPNLLTPGNSFMEGTFPDQGGGDGFAMIQLHYIFCVLNFYYYFSSTSDYDVRSLRLGTPVLGPLTDASEKKKRVEAYTNQENIHTRALLIKK